MYYISSILYESISTSIYSLSFVMERLHCLLNRM
jgi:hypothetical protein